MAATIAAASGRAAGRPDLAGAFAQRKAGPILRNPFGALDILLRFVYMSAKQR